MPGYGFSGYTPYGYSPYLDYSGYGPYAPIFLPTWQLYGPGPILRMMGVDGWFSGAPAGGGMNQAAAVLPQPVNHAIVGNAAGNVPAGAAGNAAGNAAGAVADNGQPAAQPAAKPATDLAMRFIGFGDTYFGSHKYPAALDRYQKAARADPAVADAWFRQGLVLSAMGRYAPAVKAIRHGMELSPAWPVSDFLLTDLYGADEAARKATLNDLAKAAQHDPADGDVAVLLGIHYHFNGQREEAKPLLERAAKLGNDALANAFLK